jgi:hypothetical protein
VARRSTTSRPTRIRWQAHRLRLTTTTSKRSGPRRRRRPTSRRRSPTPEEPGTEVRPALEDEEVYEGGAPDPEESYEEDEGEEGLWFEKGPPKDFDFDED